MRHKLIRYHSLVHPWRHAWSEELIALFLVLFIFIAPASAAMRLQERSLYMNDATPGATSSYTVSFRYMSPQPIGSVDMLFCIDPIPHHECVTPPGLDASNAVLSDQSGETGYSIAAQSTNHIVLSRTPSTIGLGKSSYTFDNIINPTDTKEPFSIRLRTHTTNDATGPQVDFGSVRGEVTDSIEIITQVPPMLVFCVAEEVGLNCETESETNYFDLGALDHRATLTAQSQMAVGTNASGGFAITANGTPLSAGTNVIDSMEEPAESRTGVNQFGINLVANESPAIGKDPEGPWTNAITSPDYSIPDQYKFVPGDVVAYSPNVSLIRKFTVSYVINTEENLRPGVYSTTVTYIASGRF